MKSCLIITDVQNDFLPGGALAVADGDLIVPVINKISPEFDRVVATQDWHPPGHVSFASTHGSNLYEVITVNGLKQVMWPDHCVAGTSGADFHKDLDLRHADLIIRKGAHRTIDSYSTFLENDKKTGTGLEYYLKGLGITDVFLCGLATDYCVYYSALDAKNMGFNVSVVIDACKGVDVPRGNVAKCLEIMKEREIRIVKSDHLL